MKAAEYCIEAQVTISPIFLVEGDDQYGLFRKEEILEGNELRLYYTAYKKIIKLMSTVPKHTPVMINMILNEYKEFSEDKLVTALMALRDVFKCFTYLRPHLYDEKSAKEKEIIM